MLRSATLKLTLYYLAIIAVISLGFSTVVYKVALNDLEYGLQRQTIRLKNDFPVFNGSPYLRAGNELHDARRHIIARLILFNMCVLGVAGVASYALARRTLEPIEANHERQKRFTADVSHELRTPLTALTMESQVALLDTKLTTAELRAVIASNVEEAEKLTNLISNLLKLSQLDAAMPIQSSELISTGELIAAAMQQLTPLATSRQITISSNGNDDLKIPGDQSLLTQLVVILLENAVKYSPPHSSVMVEAKDEAAYVAISIVDHGPGIPKDDLVHVFDRFYRADAARSSSQASGFGLGLSIAQLIADSHGASIQLSSRLGRGTTATIQLPRELRQQGAER